VYIRLLASLLLAAAMFVQPQEVLASALGGLNLWWRFVLPALLPFFILSELLMASGLVQFLGVLLEPLMRPLFRLPGAAAFVVAMGYTSGFPMGAVLTARLRQAGELTREEGERLVAFTNNPSPGFMFGAVASGMLGRPALGVLLASSVYLANLVVGFLLRYYRPPDPDVISRPNTAGLVAQWREVATRQQAQREALGQVLGNAVRQSVSTVLAVGGFIIFFAVLLRLLVVWRIIPALTQILGPLVPILSAPELEALLSGILEMTLGCQTAVNAFPTLSAQVAALAFIMGWGGLSVFAQVAGFSGGTDLRLNAYFSARILHAMLAAGLSQLFLHLVPIPASALSLPTLSAAEFWWQTWRLSSSVGLASFAFLLALGMLARVLRMP